MADTRLRSVEGWFAEHGWEPFGFQRAAWTAYLDGESGLIHAGTGTGKTLAAFLGPVSEYQAAPSRLESKTEPLTVIWLTPLRALAADTERSLLAPVEAMGLPWRVERRTGDTSQSVRKRQRKNLPTVLITTPESLSLLLTHSWFSEQCQTLKAVVVDEWHELIGSKRGVMTELCLARLRQWRPSLKTWGLSATLGNLGEAMSVLLGSGHVSGRMIEGEVPKDILIDTLAPANPDRFPYAGHLGMALVPQVIDAIESAKSTLLFTNTRRASETWFRALLEAKPEWAGQIAVHHGSLARARRRFVEDALKTGRLRCAVCTSSLDLGVDFPPVDRVLQVGSPKGVARLLQRAGRSGHQPGRPSRITGVPTQAFELLEFAAAREAVDEGTIEAREPLIKPLDLLAQHIITVAAGTGFVEDELLAELRSTYAYASLTDEEFRWALGFAVTGGEALKAYEQFQRLERFEGRWLVRTTQALRAHRLSIGTIVGDADMQVQYLRGQKLGTVQESFISRLEPGDAFYLAGKTLQLVRVRDMKAYVRRAPANTDLAAIPRFTGSRLPLSTGLSDYVRRQLDRVRRDPFDSPEGEALDPIFALQRRWSTIPASGEVLIERIQTREGHHLFVYPFAGRLVHEGMAAVLALRMSRLVPITFVLSFNDYGFALLSREPAPLGEALDNGLFESETLEQDLQAALNETEMAKRQFREVARIAGLVGAGLPGRGKSVRQLQMSASLVYDVLTRYDPGNLLLRQARREALERQLERSRLHAALERLAASDLVIETPPRLTPLAFPLWAERMQEKVSSEKLADRIRRQVLRLERAART